MNEFDSMDVYELQGYYSDFHKDFYGFQARLHTTEQWYNRAWLIHEIESLHTEFDRLKASPAGREQLRINGWQLDQ